MNDSIGLYLNEIGKVPLLTADEEKELSRVIEAGREAERRLESGEKRAELRKATARPIPELAPVTSATLLSRRFIVVSAGAGTCLADQEPTVDREALTGDLLRRGTREKQARRRNVFR